MTRTPSRSSPCCRSSDSTTSQPSRQGAERRSGARGRDPFDLGQGAGGSGGRTVSGEQHGARRFGKRDKTRTLRGWPCLALATQLPSVPADISRERATRLIGRSPSRTCLTAACRNSAVYGRFGTDFFIRPPRGQGIADLVVSVFGGPGHGLPIRSLSSNRCQAIGMAAGQAVNGSISAMGRSDQRARAKPNTPRGAAMTATRNNDPSTSNQ